MSILVVANGASWIPFIGICSNPDVPVNIFGDLISAIPLFQEDSTLLNEASTLDSECSTALRKCKIEDSPWHPISKIEGYLKKVKEKYTAQEQERIARKEGKLPVSEEAPIGEAGQVEGKVLVKGEDAAPKEDILVSIGVDLYAGGGAKAVFIFRHMYDCADTKKRSKWFKATQSWASGLREASGKRLSKLELDPFIEAWCDSDPRYCQLKNGTIGTPSPSKDAPPSSNSKLDEAGGPEHSQPSQSKNATDSPHPQHNEEGDSGHLRPLKRRRGDSSNGQPEDGEQSTNTPSNHTQASLGLGMQQEARRVEVHSRITDPKQSTSEASYQ
ncbi:hypothetical protein IFR05_015917 [Cadophora sp. M221]|nr:hypothetical protein IFR05_015917 [Cadophora sp. M221]